MYTLSTSLIHQPKGTLTMRLTPFVTGIFKLLLVLLFLLSLFAVIGHYMPVPDLELVVQQSIPPGPEWYGPQRTLYNHHSTISFLHIVPSLGLTLLVPVLLSQRIRSRWPAVHRWSGRLFLFLAVIVTLFGILIALIFPFAGSGEALVILLISTVFVFCLSYAYRKIRHGEVAAHRRWMIRALAAGFSAATMRVFFAIILATTDASAKEIFTFCLWSGFLLNMLLAEIWIILSYGKSNIAQATKV